MSPLYSCWALSSPKQLSFCFPVFLLVLSGKLHLTWVTYRSKGGELFSRAGATCQWLCHWKKCQSSQEHVYKSLGRVEASLDSSSWVCLLNLALLPLQHPQGKRLLAGSHKDLNLNPGVWMDLLLYDDGNICLLLWTLLKCTMKKWILAVQIRLRIQLILWIDVKIWHAVGA